MTPVGGGLGGRRRGACCRAGEGALGSGAARPGRRGPGGEGSGVPRSGPVRSGPRRGWPRTPSAPALPPAGRCLCPAGALEAGTDQVQVREQVQPQGARQVSGAACFLTGSQLGERSGGAAPPFPPLLPVPGPAAPLTAPAASGGAAASWGCSGQYFPSSAAGGRGPCPKPPAARGSERAARRPAQRSARTGQNERQRLLPPCVGRNFSRHSLQ